jgi:glycosyltransferase involved in cell wall biosynthesis
MFDRIIFWEPTESPHKSGLLNALAIQLPDTEILCCAQEGISISRREQGWEDNSSHKFVTRIAPGSDEIESYFTEGSPNTFHVFSGIRHVPIIIKALQIALRCKSKFAILSEPRVYEGIKGKLRVVQSLVEEREIARQCSLVLAIGANGPQWFTRVGYSKDKVVPFAYFVPEPVSDAINSPIFLNNRNGLRIGYLGRLVREKGVLDLIPAVSLVKTHCTLDIVGIGDQSNILREQARQSSKVVQLHGPIAMRDVSKFLQELDLLILPSISTNDGWGVVVSEALMSGTQVITTRCAGASLAVAQQLTFGRVVEPHSPKEIAAAVDSLANFGAFDRAMRHQRAVMARNLLSSTVGARYFRDLLTWVHNGGPMPKNLFFSKQPINNFIACSKDI